MEIARLSVTPFAIHPSPFIFFSFFLFIFFADLRQLLAALRRTVGAVDGFKQVKGTVQVFLRLKGLFERQKRLNNFQTYKGLREAVANGFGDFEGVGEFFKCQRMIFSFNFK